MDVLHGLTSEFAHGRAFSEVVTVADPAAGVGLTYTVGSKYYERIASLSFTLVSDGNAANRQVAVTINAVTYGVIATVAAGGVQAASLTRTYTFLKGFTSSNAVAGSAFVAPFPDIFLQPEWTVVVGIGSVQVGDQISLVRLLVERFDTGPAGFPIGMVNESPLVDQLERLSE